MHYGRPPAAPYRSGSATPLSVPRLVFLALLLAGCTYTRPAQLDSAGGRAEVNARAERGHAVLALTGERGRQVRALHVAPDVTTWTDKRTGEARSAPTADVAAVTFRRDGAGALKGAAIGAGVGAVLGFVAGRSPGDDAFITLSPTVWAGLGAVNGVWVGALVGAAHSERHVYRVGPDASSRVGAVRAGPPCGGPPLACAALARPAGR